MRLRDQDQTRNLRAVYPNVPIGEGTYGGLRIFDWGDGTKISIGAYTSFAFEVDVLLGGGHTSDWVTQFPFAAMWPEAASWAPESARSKGDIRIGSDVWVGAEAMILSGVTIGDGAIVAARSLVNKSIAPFSIVAGAPAKEIGFRFTEWQRGTLLKIAWWDWPRWRIAAALPYLLQPNLDSFIERVYEGKL